MKTRKRWLSFIKTARQGTPLPALLSDKVQPLTTRVEREIAKRTVRRSMSLDELHPDSALGPELQRMVRDGELGLEYRSPEPIRSLMVEEVGEVGLKLIARAAERRRKRANKRLGDPT
jgi:hypothetical protein